MLATLLENLDLVWTSAATVVTIASVVTAGTRTPDPATPLGKVYSVIEILALVTGRTKQTGP